ncbi:Protein CBG27290 [Caenorhabditis briggsae]|nr:Protein CBG27290 [Caenorhabditis briggsae]CAS00997.1 Protein CBG27290 [Caenorhabditis briggsae]
MVIILIDRDHPGGTARFTRYYGRRKNDFNENMIENVKRI